MAPGRGDEVEIGLKLSCSAIGLNAPPGRAYVRVLPRQSDWSFQLWSSDLSSQELFRWLTSHGEFELTADPMRGGGSVSFTASQLPAAWARLCTSEGTLLLTALPSGSVRVNLTGSRRTIRELVVVLSDRDPGSVIDHLDTEPEGHGSKASRLLTGHQEQALIAAESAGYFDIPRRIQLSDLAEKLDTSPAALSELLRRAEARLVRDHLHGGPEAAKQRASEHEDRRDREEDREEESESAQARQ